jgi:hypothetical protein
MQIRIITFDDSHSLVPLCRQLFPSCDVGIQRGVDVRHVDTTHLIEADLITHSAAHTMQHRRRHHHDIGSKGGLGLAHANRLALMESFDEPLLLLEADCVFRNPQEFVQTVHLFLQHQHEFDLVVFGMNRRSAEVRHSEEWYPPQFRTVKGMFWYTHCVLYSPSGRKKVSELLHRPLDMQIDSLYGSHSYHGSLRIIGEIRRTSRFAYQRVHVSSIQTDDNQWVVTVVVIILGVSSLVVCTRRMVSRRRLRLNRA